MAVKTYPVDICAMCSFYPQELCTASSSKISNGSGACNGIWSFNHGHYVASPSVSSGDDSDEWRDVECDSDPNLKQNAEEAASLAAVVLLESDAEGLGPRTETIEASQKKKKKKKLSQDTDQMNTPRLSTSGLRNCSESSTCAGSASVSTASPSRQLMFWESIEECETDSSWTPAGSPEAALRSLKIVSCDVCLL